MARKYKIAEKAVLLSLDRPVLAGLFSHRSISLPRKLNVKQGATVYLYENRKEGGSMMVVGEAIVGTVSRRFSIVAGKAIISTHLTQAKKYSKRIPITMFNLFGKAPSIEYMQEYHLDTLCDNCPYTDFGSTDSDSVRNVCEGTKCSDAYEEHVLNMYAVTHAPSPVTYVEKRYISNV